jgi:hypothetical protein
MRSRNAAHSLLFRIWFPCRARDAEILKFHADGDGKYGAKRSGSNAI